MNLAALVLHLRGEVLRDTATPTIWSTANLKEWINEAQQEWVSSLVFPVTAVQVTIPAGSNVGESAFEIYVLDTAKIGANSIETTQGVFDELDTSVTTLAYAPLSKAVEVNAVVDEDTVVTLRGVFAPPILSADEDVPIIPEQYHLSLCTYAAWKALTNNDVEGGAQVSSAATHLGNWSLSIMSATARIARSKVGRINVATSSKGFV